MTNFIEQRKNLHRRLQENDQRINLLQEQIQATQKMATLGTMACLAAHEFNNILVPMINYSELALQNPDDVPLMRKALEKTIEHGQRASVIIQSMLGLVRDQGKEREWVRLREIVDECFRCIARDLEKDQIQRKVELDDDLQVFAVPGQLLQVLLNLVINARQAMLDNGGVLTVQARQNNDEVTIRVRDTGCGIEPEIIDQIFDPLFTTKTAESHPEEQGTGLGLMICKDIIEAHNGMIEVDSSPGCGAAFVIKLPHPQQTPTRSTTTHNKNEKA